MVLKIKIDDDNNNDTNNNNNMNNSKNTEGCRFQSEDSGVYLNDLLTDVYYLLVFAERAPPDETIVARCAMMLADTRIQSGICHHEAPLVPTKP